MSAVYPVEYIFPMGLYLRISCRLAMFVNLLRSFKVPAVLSFGTDRARIACVIDKYNVFQCSFPQCSYAALPA